LKLTLSWSVRERLTSKDRLGDLCRWVEDSIVVLCLDKLYVLGVADDVLIGPTESLSMIFLSWLNTSPSKRLTVIPLNRTEIHLVIRVNGERVRSGVSAR
jgi:hypothetical protein